MTKFTGQYYCQEQNKYHLEYQNKHYYFDSIKEATNFMDKVEEDNMKKQTKQGLDNAPKIMQEFVMTLDKNKQKTKQSLLSKHRDKIEKAAQTPYTLIKWFMVASMIVAVVIEQGAYQYVA